MQIQGMFPNNKKERRSIEKKVQKTLKIINLNC